MHDGRLVVMNTEFRDFKYQCKADENLRLICASLPEAVEACIDAAGHEFGVSHQRTLLRAASYGQAFCSIEQYKHKLLSVPVLVSRLINAHQHLLALRISEYIGMNQMWIKEETDQLFDLCERFDLPLCCDSRLIHVIS